jgi:cytoskeletal protein RodZ
MRGKERFGRNAQERIIRHFQMAAGEFSRERVGEYLKRVRESRSVSLEEISKNTRISRPYLEALERNDFRFFSRPEYIQGFLRGYARHIGLDPGDILRRYEVQMEVERLQGTFRQLPLFHTSEEGGGVDPENQEEASVSPALKERIPFSRTTLIQVAILAAALILSFYLYKTLKQLDQNANPPKAESLSPKEDRNGAEAKRDLPPPKENPEKREKLR